MRLSEDLHKIAEMREDLEDTSESIDIPPDLDPSITLQEFAPSPVKKTLQPQSSAADMPRDDNGSFTATSLIHSPLPPPLPPPRHKETKKMATTQKAPAGRSSFAVVAVLLGVTACAGTGYLYFLQTNMQTKLQTIAEEIKKTKVPGAGEIDAHIRRFLVKNPESMDEMTTRELEVLQSDVERLKASQTALETETRMVKEEALRTLAEATKLAAKRPMPVAASPPVTSSSSTKQAAEMVTTKKASLPPKNKNAGQTTTTNTKSTKPVHWAVNLVSEKERAKLTELQDKLIRAGMTPEIKEVIINGVTWYRLLLTGYASKQSALNKKNELARTLGIQSAWIDRQ